MVSEIVMLPSRDVLLKLYEFYTLSEIGDLYGVSRQAVFKKIGGVPPELKIWSKRKKFGNYIIELLQAGRSQTEVSDIVGLSVPVVADIARGIKYPTKKHRGRTLPIGCDDCKTKPYAKGLCLRCYHRQRRRKAATASLPGSGSELGTTFPKATGRRSTKQCGN